MNKQQYNIILEGLTTLAIEYAQDLVLAGDDFTKAIVIQERLDELKGVGIAVLNEMYEHGFIDTARTEPRF